jgi:hypothetical protein
MFCRHCGNQLEDNVKFCSKCGQSVEGEAATGVGVPIEPTQLAGSKFLIVSAWQNYKSKFRQLMTWQLLAIAPVLVAIGIGALLVNFFVSDTTSTAVMVVGGIVLLFVVVLLIYWSVWIQASQIQSLLDEERRTIKEVMATTKPKLRNYFWASVVSALIIMGGFVLLIIPGIIFSVWYGFAMYIALAENSGAIDSLRKSKGYVEGQWWKVFGRSIVLMLVGIAIYIPIIIVGAILNSIVGDVGGTIVNNLANLILGPFFLALGLALYKAMKATKGEIIVPPTGRTKYVVFAVLAFLLIPVMILGSVVLLALNSARVKSRDALRVAEVRQIATAAELYYNDRGQYPTSLNDLTPDYLNTIPTAPTPAEPGCTEEENSYSYRALSTQEYEISFCLGGATGEFDAGVNTYGYQVEQ